ncbi:MAG: 2-oxoacid:acceptor oxidoreductase family protein [Prevotella stercorea]|jgi:2-oxoglutarate ferredoxin oxidoreductase subunit gamma|uniref:2-oxoacid:acceptor oxidoreductase family protein n=1 Tax=Leyella stercorea TaxID=363265 RepID=UPI000336A924|nr:2-oxoacid:acceptor oxidoreductase family protein [Leyella stercorea]MCI5988562.1 2-oxoacid:acceptor oxidoreductase family protein [Prevotella sp.]CDB05800.1 2-oxoacid:ferredoxin/flavodoxin oxidoreductase gamma subunit [Prevotella sp. CAG:520]MCF2615331.1 2-oxoacid:acceptor oxidoreductase family protein [Leyella stercorea]MCI6105748.1 2-oxoacid:acceptor oxidoreductase family protein [Prevotella sp.]MCI6132409.1 2-oxoacid:acceptor oxidoreductase family protein [Prevotella sp.]
MKAEIIIAGFGGQGVLSMGKILAYSGLMEDKEVTWMPAYGPEQRGGTANVTVIVSEERISSPILSQYDVAIVLNQPSLDKFESKVKPGGILIYDGFGIINPPTRKDINVYRIDAMDKAAELKNSKVFNMIVLGGLLKVCPIVSTNGLNKALYKTLPERHHGLIPLNMEAVEAGGQIIEKV